MHLTYVAKGGSGLSTVDPATDKVSVRKLREGSEYRLRCVVKDPASNFFISKDVLVKVGATAKTANLAERLSAK